MHSRTAIAFATTRAPRGMVVAAMTLIDSTTGTGTGTTSGAGCGGETE